MSGWDAELVRRIENKLADGPTYPSVIASALGMEESRVKLVLHGLESRDRVRRHHGRYVLVDYGDRDDEVATEEACRALEGAGVDHDPATGEARTVEALLVFAPGDVETVLDGKTASIAKGVTFAVEGGRLVAEKRFEFGLAHVLEHMRERGHAIPSGARVEITETGDVAVRWRVPL